MNNADYWAQRMKNMTDALEDKSYEYVKNLEEQFDRSIAEVEKDIAHWYQRFADNNDIDLAEAKKLLTKGELKELKWSVEEYIKYGKENAINEQWMSELENASAKAHISRLDGLKLQLTQQAEKLSRLTEKATESAGKGIYEDCYYRTAFELQQQIGVGTVMGGIDERRIEKVLSRPWTTDNKTFRDRCWTNKTALVNSVNRELTQMIMRGEKPDRTIKAIANQFDVAKSKAGRLVMTESAFFAQQSQKDCFNELDVEKCKVVAALDKHTCSICGKLDGTIIKMSDYEVGSTAPPFHPWCRCTTAPYFEDMKGIGERYARDVETGESFSVPKDMTYEQWKKLQDEKVENLDKSGIIDLYSNKGIKVISDEEIDNKTVKQVEKATKKVTKDFKILKEYSEPISFEYIDSGLAENIYNFKTGLNRIVLCKDSFSNPNKLLQKLNTDYHAGISYKTNTIQSLVAHEMGHNAHIALALKNSNLLYGVPLTSEQSIIFMSEYERIRNEVYEYVFDDATFEEITNSICSELGSLGTQGSEIIAQSFGNYYYGNKKSQIADKVVEYFMKGLS